MSLYSSDEFKISKLILSSKYDISWISNNLFIKISQFFK